MISKNDSKAIIIDGVVYAVGMYITCTDQSDYKGLSGIITDILTDDEKETDNETVDIYCCFAPPKLHTEIDELEERFSALHDHPVIIDDIALDCVIMAPSMIRPVKRCRIYQIAPSDRRFAFRGYKYVREQGLEAPPSHLYRAVFDGQLHTEVLDDIFRIFNLEHPKGFCGHSLSVSDIIELYDEKGSKFFFCDTIGFKLIPFEPIHTAVYRWTW